MGMVSARCIHLVGMAGSLFFLTVAIEGTRDKNDDGIEEGKEIKGTRKQVTASNAQQTNAAYKRKTFFRLSQEKGEKGEKGVKEGMGRRLRNSCRDMLDPSPWSRDGPCVRGAWI